MHSHILFHPFSRDNDIINLRYIFNEGLTQADIASLLAIIDNIHINGRHLRRRLARLQVYRWSILSGPDVIVASLAEWWSDSLKVFITGTLCTRTHLRTHHKSLYPLSARCTVNHFITFSKNRAGTLQVRTHTIHRNTDVLGSQQDAFKIKVPHIVSNDNLTSKNIS